MRRLLSSLQVRLIVGFVAALALALSSVGLYVGYAADREVARLREEFTDAREARLKLALEEHYARNKGWYQVQPFLERVGPVYGKRLVLKDEDGQIVGDSWGDKKGFPSGRTRPHRGITISMSEADPRMASVMEDKKREVGELTVAADDLPEPLMEPPLSRLSQTVNRSLLWAGLVAGGGGLVLVTMMSSSALAPVRTLTGAARRLGRGDLSQRVSVRGEDEVGQLARTFNSMAEGMEQAETQRRNLVADVAHELRSPLSNIQGTIEAMRDGLMDRGDSSLDMLHEQTLHLSQPGGRPGAACHGGGGRPAPGHKAGLRRGRGQTAPSKHSGPALRRRASGSPSRQPRICRWPRWTGSGRSRSSATCWTTPSGIPLRGAALACMSTQRGRKP